MGLNNHLLIEESGVDLDIYFSYGEVRELFYRIGDEIFFGRGNLSSRNTFVPGCLYSLEKNEDGSFKDNRFFKIELKDGLILRAQEVSQDEYGSLEGSS